VEVAAKLRRRTPWPSKKNLERPRSALRKESWNVKLFGRLSETSELKQKRAR